VQQGKEGTVTSRQMMPIVSALLFGVLTSATGGCSNAGEGAVSGAGIGALSGLAIGSITGEAGKGAAIGAIAGGVGGAVIGDQNRRKTEAAAAAAYPPPPPPTQVVTVYSSSKQTTYVTGQPLGWLVGNWQISGSVDDGNGGTLPVSGTATGIIDKNFFVRVDLRLKDPRSSRQVEGTSMISQTGGRGIEMTNSFSSSPDVARFRGEMDASGSLFTLSELSPSPGTRRIILRITPGREWTADVWRGNVRSESFRFTPAQAARS